MKLLHVTAHLGGGVGKVLSRLVEASARRGDGITHTIACLETPQKTAFVDHARRHGASVLCAPDATVLEALARDADLVQLEWWHHPAVARWMGSDALPPMRLVVWSHVSGLIAPEIPPAFVALPHRFLLSSPCSLAHPALANLPTEVRARLAVVVSSGGFDDLPAPPVRGDDTPLRTGYLGTLNFAKLHPGILDFVAAVRAPGFRLEMFGDPDTTGALQAETAARGLSDRIALNGYTTDVAGTLAGLDVVAYLLNPQHYGTAENALLEAMAMGVVPVVLDNPAERMLVSHEHTGLVVRTPAEFADAIDRLAASPALRRQLSANASASVRARFSLDQTAAALAAHYRAVMQEEKRTIDFRAVFGDSPADWFLSCQGAERWRFDAASPAPAPRDVTSPHHLTERTKSSVFHYRDAFPDDTRLNRWATTMAAQP
ncbi:MAG: glycosyltransferase family 4 protein [Rhodocyclaceae bacterium]|nr:glycosyltransferase family 4 protein [Rhodocyclaceae bacterium]